jgi:hypothetical protein
MEVVHGGLTGNKPMGRFYVGLKRLIVVLGDFAHNQPLPHWYGKILRRRDKKIFLMMLKQGIRRSNMPGKLLTILSSGYSGPSSR